MLKEEDVLDRTKWKNDIRYHSGDPQMMGKVGGVRKTIGHLMVCVYYHYDDGFEEFLCRYIHPRHWNRSRCSRRTRRQ